MPFRVAVKSASMMVNWASMLTSCPETSPSSRCMASNLALSPLPVLQYAAHTPAMIAMKSPTANKRVAHKIIIRRYS